MRIGVLTSGGDAPGMNAAIRTVAVVGYARGHQVMGVRRGYEGLLAGDVVELDRAAVDGISRFGGTSLGSARSAEFPPVHSRKATLIFRGRIGNTLAWKAKVQSPGVLSYVFHHQLWSSPNRTTVRSARCPEPISPGL